MATKSVTRHVAWYEQNRKLFSSLANNVNAILETLIQQEHIPIVGIESRAKEIASFEKKIRNKRYNNPKSEMMDLAGVRVITLIERDIERVSKIIQATFNVHPNDSTDKSDELGTDKFGYRSVHFICDIGVARESLPEFAPYKNLLFEIQVRTALQHAWAEIEHDRNYKFSGELPSPFKRRFYLIAGLLELADKEFSSLTAELERYTSDVQTKTTAGIFDIELNSTSALAYIQHLVAMHSELKIGDLAQLEQEQDVIAELRRFGINSISDFATLFSESFLRDIYPAYNTTAVGIVRDAMIYTDVDKYFEVAWQHSWDFWEEEAESFVNARYGQGKFAEVVAKFNVQVAATNNHNSPDD